jgi:hypothetical protein
LYNAASSNGAVKIKVTEAGAPWQGPTRNTARVR